ncbi:MAG TPA: hypothetical protein VGQ08_09420 [Nitrospiraceae bacterium]|jgi:predicted DNA-binding protein|nr:hypothetical protein [Nitrospiraceae bacterium]
MLFDPDDRMTLGQSIEIARKKQTPAMQARVDALADELGWTRNEIILECRRRFLEDLEDPAKRHALHDNTAKPAKTETRRGGRVAEATVC